MQSLEPVLVALERILYQQLVADHLLRSEIRRSCSKSQLDLAFLSQA